MYYSKHNNGEGFSSYDLDHLLIQVLLLKSIAILELKDLKQQSGLMIFLNCLGPSNRFQP